jgi:hypothetical protein
MQKCEGEISKHYTSGWEIRNTIRLKIASKYRVTPVTQAALTFDTNLVKIKHDVLTFMYISDKPVLQMGVSWAMPDRGVSSRFSLKKIISKATNYDKTSSCCRG